MQIDQTPTSFPFAKVEAARAALQNGDPDWTYTATNPTGSLGPCSRIEIHDEDGEFVGFA